MKRNVDIITMGCSKNLVDTEHLMYMLKEIGFNAYCNPDKTHGGVAVVNTCGFIQAAKEESIDAILRLCQAKKEGLLHEVIVMGCLSQRYREQLEAEIPQVDKFYGKFDWSGIVEHLKSTYGIKPEGGNAAARCDGLDGRRVLTTLSHYAYIKISEGCDRRCSYCAIPLITGSQKSRSMEDIVNEVKALVAGGTKEFQIIAQDSTSYGTDIYGRQMLPELIERISDVPGVEWIRIHYAYPNNFPMRLLQVIRERSNVCDYLDIALQHINDNVLKKMHRNITGTETRELISRIREEVPGIALRTTLMVGFPGETAKAFEELMEFVNEARFDRMGAFAYSEEDGTYAAMHYKDSISGKLKQQRLDALMSLQQKISSELGRKRVGRVYKTIIDRKEGDYYIGRTEFDSPEVDEEVLIPAKSGLKLSAGNFYDMRITSSNEYDLYAEPVNA